MDIINRAAIVQKVKDKLDIPLTSLCFQRLRKLLAKLRSDLQPKFQILAKSNDLASIVYKAFWDKAAILHDKDQMALVEKVFKGELGFDDGNDPSEDAKLNARLWVAEHTGLWVPAWTKLRSAHLTDAFVDHYIDAGSDPKAAGDEKSIEDILTKFSNKEKRLIATEISAFDALETIIAQIEKWPSDTYSHANDVFDFLRYVGKDKDKLNAGHAYLLDRVQSKWTGYHLLPMRVDEHNGHYILTVLISTGQLKKVFFLDPLQGKGDGPYRKQGDAFDFYLRIANAGGFKTPKTQTASECGFLTLYLMNRITNLFRNVDKDHETHLVKFIETMDKADSDQIAVNAVTWADTVVKSLSWKETSLFLTSGKIGYPSINEALQAFFEAFLLTPNDKDLFDLPNYIVDRLDLSIYSEAMIHFKGTTKPEFIVMLLVLSRHIKVGTLPELLTFFENWIEFSEKMDSFWSKITMVPVEVFNTELANQKVIFYEIGDLFADINVPGKVRDWSHVASLLWPTLFLPNKTIPESTQSERIKRWWSTRQKTVFDAFLLGSIFGYDVMKTVETDPNLIKIVILGEWHRTPRMSEMLPTGKDIYNFMGSVRAEVSKGIKDNPSIYDPMLYDEIYSIQAFLGAYEFWWLRGLKLFPDEFLKDLGIYELIMALGDAERTWGNPSLDLWNRVKEVLLPLKENIPEEPYAILLRKIDQTTSRIIKKTAPAAPEPVRPATPPPSSPAPPHVPIQPTHVPDPKPVAPPKQPSPLDDSPPSSPKPATPQRSRRSSVTIHPAPGPVPIVPDPAPVVPVIDNDSDESSSDVPLPPALDISDDELSDASFPDIPDSPDDSDSDVPIVPVPGPAPVAPGPAPIVPVVPPGPAPAPIVPLPGPVAPGPRPVVPIVPAPALIVPTAPPILTDDQIVAAAATMAAVYTDPSIETDDGIVLADRNAAFRWNTMLNPNYRSAVFESEVEHLEWQRELALNREKDRRRWNALHGISSDDW
jgi:hypothetical protein